jgi:hypothetical protein
MMSWDAMLCAESAIRLTSRSQPEPSAVAAELGALQGAHAVLGSTGPLEFTGVYNQGSTGSNPVGKAIPILQIEPDGSLRFVQLGWPNGPPPQS